MKKRDSIVMNLRRGKLLTVLGYKQAIWPVMNNGVLMYIYEYIRKYLYYGNHFQKHHIVLYVAAEMICMHLDPPSCTCELKLASITHFI